MLPFIMFNSTPVLGHQNNLETSKQYRAPHARAQQIKEKKDYFGLWSKS